MAYNPNASKLMGLDPNYYNKQGQGYGTDISNPLNADGSPSWIGGTGNPLYKPTNTNGSQRATVNPYDAIAAQKEKALQQQRDAQNLQITQQADISRATLGGQSQANARNLAEYLAQRGLTSSGTAAQGEINRLGTLQQGIGALEQQKANALTGVETQYQSGLATAQEEALQQAQAQEKERMASAIATIGVYGQDYQAEINKRMAVNPNDPLIPYLQMARQEKLTGIATSSAKQKQQDFENNLALQKYNLSVYNANKPSASDLPKSFALTSSEIAAKLKPQKVTTNAYGVPVSETVELTPTQKGIELAKMRNSMSESDYQGYAQYYNVILPSQVIASELPYLKTSAAKINAIQGAYDKGYINDSEATYLLTQYKLL